MTTLAVIPARLGATRLPRKPVQLLGGQPLIVRVWERVCELDVADYCVVATDSDEVAAAARAGGAEAVITRTDHHSGTDRVAEVASLPSYRGFDVILNIQGDEPFVSATAVHGAVALVADGRFELGTAASTASGDILGSPSVVKVIADDSGRAMYFSRAGVPFLRDGRDAKLLDGRIWQHLGIYAYTRAALARWVALPPHPLEQIEQLEQLRPLCAGIPMGVARVDQPACGGIDTEEDLRKANLDWTNFVSGRV